MKSMAISAFKAHALQVLDRVASTQECIVITRRGKPLAKVFPCPSPDEAPAPGRLSSTLVFEKDIVSPLGSGPWEAAR